MSDDGRHALAVIAFVGSVFSPYYALARRRGPTDPCRHVAVNVALYGPGAGRWTMTERGAGQLVREATALRIGPSALAWAEDGALVITLDEVAVPWPRRVRGRVRLLPLTGPLAPQGLDDEGRHRWQPIAPRARADVMLDSPALRWQGEGYVDANWGDAPLEGAFTGWQWSRTALPDGACLLRYDTCRRDGSRSALGMRISRDGRACALPPSTPRPAASTRWGIARRLHDDAVLRATLEDGPFYARSLLDTPWEGRWAPTVHESLSLERFDSRWVQALLPFRMPRRAGGSRSIG